MESKCGECRKVVDEGDKEEKKAVYIELYDGDYLYGSWFHSSCARKFAYNILAECG